MAKKYGKYVSQSATEMVQVVLPNDTNFFGNVLGGRVMHWIDLVGAMVAVRHSRKPVVTASMERLDFHSPIKLGDLVILKANLTFVGTSSMEVQVEIFSEEPLTGSRRPTSSAYLTYVSINEQGEPSSVLPLIPKTEKEKRLYQDGKKRRKIRLSSNTPSKRRP